MSRNLEGYCTNSTGGLSMLWCESCQIERIHRRGVCLCGTRHAAYPVRDLAEKWVSKSMTIRRKWSRK